MHSLIAGIANSFTDNLIAEQRYRMILDGLQVTLLITFCAAVLGTLLGGVVCWARMSRKPWLRQTAKIYIDLMRGTPVLVLLMLMYYVFMAPLGTTGITVAVVTFAMNASAYIGEMLRSSIESIDRGQREAGLALGHTPRQTFFRIILPQVVKSVQPVYQGEVISLLKGTSIVRCVLPAAGHRRYLFSGGMAHRSGTHRAGATPYQACRRSRKPADSAWRGGSNTFHSRKSKVES